MSLKNLKTFFTKNEDKIILIIGFSLVALLAFGAGRLSVGELSNKTPIIFQEGQNQSCNNPDTKIISNKQSVISDTSQVNNLSQSTDGSRSVPTDNLIIGNKNSMIYHLPEGKFYDKISPQNRIYFNSEEEAQKAGYRKSKL